MRRAKTADLARGYGLLVDLRVTDHRLARGEAAGVFIVGLQPEHLCEHLAPLLLEPRELLEALWTSTGTWAHSPTRPTA